MKKLCLLLALVMVFLCGCNAEDEDTGRRHSKRNESRQEQTEEVAAMGRMGFAVTDGDQVYYWQYDSAGYEDGAMMGFFADRMPATLVCRDADGNETQLVSSQTADVFVLTGTDIFFVDIDQIYRLDLQSLEKKLLTAGTLVDVDEAGQHLIINLDGVYQSYDIAQDRFTVLFTKGDYEGYNNGIVYFSISPEEYELAQRGQLTLYSVNIDGTDPQALITTGADLYDFGGVSEAHIEQMRFDEYALYFSYGSIGGSGGFYQGGKIIRLPFDGTEPEVVAGEGDLVNADFGVNEDGTVTVYEESFTPYYSGHTQYFETQEGLFWMDRKTGASQKLLSLKDYEELVSCDEAFVSLCDVWDDVAIITVNYTNIDPSQAMGWRDYFARVKTVTYKVVNGELTELYSF